MTRPEYLGEDGTHIGKHFLDDSTLGDTENSHTRRLLLRKKYPFVSLPDSELWIDTMMRDVPSVQTVKGIYVQSFLEVVDFP
jgi:hypothetical protein